MDTGLLVLLAVVGLIALAVTLVNLPAPVRAAFFGHDTDALPPHAPRNTSTPTQPATTPDPAAPRTAPHSEWWPVVVGDVHHLLIVGETQEGKSTTARALLIDRARTDSIVVIDPHAKLNGWGVPTIGDGRDFAAVDAALVALEAEMSRRYTPGEDIGAPLTIFIDEYPAIADECRHAKQAFLRLAREGAKVHMRLVVLTQDANVETLGIRGQGAARLNFARLLLSSFAVRECKALAGQAWGACLDWRGNLIIVDRSQLVRLSRRQVQARRWEPVPASDDAPEMPEEPVPEPVPGTSTVGTPDTDAVLAGNLSEDVVLVEVARRWSKNKAAAIVGGNRAAALARINALMEEHE
jgi:hypothetical protein